MMRLAVDFKQLKSDFILKAGSTVRSEHEDLLSNQTGGEILQSIRTCVRHIECERDHTEASKVLMQGKSFAVEHSASLLPLRHDGIVAQ